MIRFILLLSISLPCLADYQLSVFSPDGKLQNRSLFKTQTDAEDYLLKRKYPKSFTSKIIEVDTSERDNRKNALNRFKNLDCSTLANQLQDMCLVLKLKL